MKKTTGTTIQRGQAITFRIPSDTPDHLLRKLQKLKDTEKRNFSSRIADYVLDNIGRTAQAEGEIIRIPLPHKLDKAQRDWLKHAHSEAVLGSIVYQLLSDPLRAVSLLSALNNGQQDYEESYYAQEENEEDDLEDFDWDTHEDTEDTEDIEDSRAEKESSEEDLDELLGDFLASMNK